MAKFFRAGKIMRLIKCIVVVIIVGLLSNCASYDFSRRIVKQGNLIPSAKIARLHVGMSKQDVAVLMGTSLLSPTFDNNRWDYAFTVRKGAGAPLVRNLTLYFSGERLARIEHHP